jgi:hypothetical protein
MGFTGYDDLLSLSRGFYLILHYLFSLCHSKTSRKILRLCTKERKSPSPYPTNTKMIQVHFGPFRSKSRLATTRLHVRRHILQLLTDLPHPLRQLVAFLQQYVQLGRVRIKASLEPSERLDEALSRHSRGLSVAYGSRGPRVERVDGRPGDRRLHARRNERRRRRGDRSRWDRDFERRAYSDKIRII